MNLRPNIKLYTNDCLNVLPHLDSGSVDMILCDLPYGTTNCKWDTPIDLNRLWNQYERIIKPDGAIVLFAQTPFDKVLGASNLALLRYEWIWEKTSATGHLNAKKLPMKAHENILVFYKRQPTYNPQKTYGHIRKTASAVTKSAIISRKEGMCSKIYGSQRTDKLTDYDSTERYPRSVLKFKSDKQLLNLHETQKPLALCEYLIKTYTNTGDLVLDNCVGSGTTMVACQNTLRGGIGIDIDPINIQNTIGRLNNKYGEMLR